MGSFSTLAWVVAAMADIDNAPAAVSATAVNCNKFRFIRASFSLGENGFAAEFIRSGTAEPGLRLLSGHATRA
jgi:hypothetical protein